ncbi:MAG: ribosomal protein S18-alanine N-acetyltransferase [Oscillospiraceae bacterium]|nr:ribosomal protein S18-alanine N-acetyltransferase [Oscillospiraceae bacterium]
MGAEPLITKMRAGHARAMADLESACFSMPWTLAQIEAELQHGYAHYWAAELDGVLAGYAGMNVVLDEGYVTNVAVHPVYRRRHIGEKLMERLIEQSLEMSLVFLTLEVRKSNEAAIGMYAKLGFELWGTRPNYYSRPAEDALLMTKELRG